MLINFLKCHGTGNDFIMIDEINNDYNFDEQKRIEFTKEMCDRKGPVGGDGVLFIQNSEKCDAKMKILNSDGSEAEMCGNGLRCVGRYVIELFKKDIVEIETLKEKYIVKNSVDIFDGVKTIEICIKTICFELSSLPMVVKDKTNLLFEKIEELDPTLEFTAISISNPHIVSIMNKISTEVLVKIGKKANLPISILPSGVNVNFVEIQDDNSIYVKTFERGVGLTKSCGTGMTASSVVVCVKYPDRFGREINVFNDGGMIKTIVTKDSYGKYCVRFIGNATYIYKSKINFDFVSRNKNYNIEKEMLDDENNSYDNFLKHIRELK